MTSPTYDHTQTTAILQGEGHSAADIDTAIDSLSVAGFDLDQPDNGLLINDSDLQVLRDQLNA